MKKISGGYSLVEFDTDITFPTATQITQLLKAGTGLTPKTSTEEMADGMSQSVLKQMDMSIRSANVDNAGGSAYALLKAAEIAGTKLFFRFRNIQVNAALIDDCESDISFGAYTGVSIALDSDCMVGSSSRKFTIADNANVGVLASLTLDSPININGIVRRFWIKSSINISANQLKINFYSGGNESGIFGYAFLPALTAGVWTQLELTLTITDGSASIIGCYAFAQVSDLGAFTLKIDDLRFGAPNIIIKNVIPTVVFEENEAGKFNAMKVTGQGVAASENDLMSLTM